MSSHLFDLFCKDLRLLGLREGDTVLVHSSLRSLWPLSKDPESVIRGLLEVLGPEGTLLFPALSYASVNVENPVFDVAKTPSCVGGLPEYFRLREGTLRSIHPTHSVCGIGKKAAELLSGHEKDTTSCGENSPFRKLREQGDWILFLGCGLAPNTSMHAVEELVNPPYLHGDFVDYKIVGAENICSSMRVRRHNFRGYAQAYARMSRLLSPSELRFGSVLSSTCALMNVQALWDKALEALRKDPFAFVNRIEAD